MADGEQVEEVQGKKHGFAALMDLCGREQQSEVEAAGADLFGDEPQPERKAGRPKGRINRVTEAQAEAVRRTGVSPLGFLISIMRNDVYSLDKRMAAAVAALPYVHRKQPVAVDLNAQSGVSLKIDLSGFEDSPDEGDGGAALVIEAAARPMDPATLTIEENQQVRSVEGDKV